MSRRCRLVAALAALFVVATPAVAAADAAGPTDWRTTITAVEPATEAVRFSIEGGDAFVRADVERGHAIVVLGYDHEPYLRIDAAGIVSTNARSFATYYNEDRYGNDDIPEVVDNEAEPVWQRVGDGGSWSWHDHRAHWMGDEPPIGLEPGDSLPRQTIPVLVDGARVEVAVETELVGSPSFWPALLGGLVGLQIGLVGAWVGRATSTLATLILATAATVAGAAQFRSLPASTGPLVTWWLLPASALLASLGVIAIYRRVFWTELGLQAIAAVFLLLWAFRRRGHLTSAVVPTDLSAALDRAITAAVSVGALLVLVGTLRRLTTASASNSPPGPEPASEP